MKVIKQLNDNQFVIELGERENILSQTVTLAHDYLRMEDTYRIPSDVVLDVNGVDRNSLPIRVQTTIGIREFHHFLEVIKDHKFLRSEHLLKEDGKPNYTWGDEDTLVINIDGKRRYFARDKDKIIEITEGIWKRLQSSSFS